MIVTSPLLAGIDKLSLTTREFTVDDRNQLVTKTTTGPGLVSSFLFKDKAGHEVWGNNSYHNTERLSMSISGHGMQIVVNPSKLFHPYELLHDVGRLKEVEAIIEHDLREVGVKADLRGSKVFRLDLAKQTSMAQPVLMYAEAFRTVKAKRLTGRTYPNGFYFSNKQSEACFYDKALEAKIVGLPNFMRGEARFKKGDAVQKLVGVDCFGSLVEMDADYLTGKYNAYMQDRVFKPSNKGNHSVLDFTEEQQHIQFLQERYPRSWFKEWLILGGIEQKVIGLGGLEGVKQLLSQVEHRAIVHRHINQLNEMLQIKGMYDASRGDLTISSMIDEVRQRFVA